MKKHLLILLVSVFSINSYSQIQFENGYYIDNSDQKIECQIKNIDWRDNPIEFEYRLSENDEPQIASLKSVKEFGIYNASRYIRQSVNIDRSSDLISSLSKERTPNFIKKELYLKVLSEGKATLYEYNDGNLKRYFYKTENSNVEQLIYKRYKTEYNKIGVNNYFRQQLWRDMKCPDFKMSKLENIKYKKRDLLKYFEDYSKCNNADLVYFGHKEKRDLFNLTLRPRLNSSSLSIENSILGFSNNDFGNEMGFGFGLETEFILPFNNNKWSLIIEPTYRYFKSDKTTKPINFSGGELIAKVDYNSIEVPAGIRHYFFLNNNSKIFANISYVFDISFNSTIKYSRKDGTSFNELELDTRNNIAFGLGYKHNDKYGIELRYQTNREILGNYAYWSSEYKAISVIIGYSLF